MEGNFKISVFVAIRTTGRLFLDLKTFRDAIRAKIIIRCQLKLCLQLPGGFCLVKDAVF